MKTCKTCEHFERLNWHESMGGGEQLGGNCQLLLHVLNIIFTYKIRSGAYFIESRRWWNHDFD